VADAIVNPHQVGDSYPEQILCGSGVVFKLVQALIKNSTWNIPAGWEKWLLDLVAIATVSDMVPLVGENRALVHFGLRVLRKTRRLGLRRMFEVLGLDLPAITESDIAFSLGPRLNAASRMASATDAYTFLTTTNLAQADTLARQLDLYNTARKSAVVEIVAASKDKLVGLESAAVLVLGDTNWSPTSLGLVAGRLAESEQRPVFVWGKNGDSVIKGSVRSVAGVNAVELMTLAQQLAGGELFTNFGGHSMAGGFSLASEAHTITLVEVLQRAYQQLAPTLTAAELPIDSLFSLESLVPEAFQTIELLAPYGVGNPRPLFLFTNVVPREIKKFGAEKNHLELVFDARNTDKISAVQFFAPETVMQLARKNAALDMVASLEKNCFRGRTTWRLRIAELDAAS
jgi:single-stranded-DNA-specific exonuclease